MLKIPRFMKEYASYMEKELSENPLLNERIKADWIAGINKVVTMRKIKTTKI